MSPRWLDRLGEPDLALGGLRLSVHGRESPSATDYWDGNWLRATARHGGGRGAGLTGAFLHVGDIVGWRAALEPVVRGVAGEAELVTVEEELGFRVVVLAEAAVVVETELRPDHVEVVRLSETVDGAALVGSLAMLDALLCRFPVVDDTRPLAYRVHRRRDPNAAVSPAYAWIMTVDRSSTSGEADLVIGELSIWVHGQAYAHSEYEDDQDVLEATAIYASSEGSFVRASGPFLRSSELATLRHELGPLYADLRGAAELDCLDAHLTVRLEARHGGHIEISTFITPDHAEVHRFHDGFDQTFLPPVIAQLDAILDRYPAPLLTLPPRIRRTVEAANDPPAPRAARRFLARLWPRRRASKLRAPD